MTKVFLDICWINYSNYYSFAKLYLFACEPVYKKYRKTIFFFGSQSLIIIRGIFECMVASLFQTLNYYR